MAEMVTVMACSHSPFLFTAPEHWNAIRQRRPLREDVPFDRPEENVAKYERCQQAFKTLREHIVAAKPDVVIIFGDDQQEQFDSRTMPTFGIYTGAEFAGWRTVGRPYQPAGHRQELQKTPDNWVTVRGCPELASELHAGLIEREFDLAGCQEMPNPDVGMGHAFMRPAYHLSPDFDLPIIPIFLNDYYLPLPRAHRCYRLGEAVREVIESSALDLRVAVLGSGGLWHTPGASDAYLDEAFDRHMLDCLRAGPTAEMADYFDCYQPRPSGGTGEVRNWIAAAGVSAGVRWDVIDYVDAYASPVGLAFAFCNP